MKQNLLVLLASAAMLGGCATTNDSARDESRDEGVYLTGSRLPQKTSGSSSIQTYDKEGWDDNTRGHKQINPQGR